MQRTLETSFARFRYLTYLSIWCLICYNPTHCFCQSLSFGYKHELYVDGDLNVSHSTKKIAAHEYKISGEVYGSGQPLYAATVRLYFKGKQYGGVITDSLGQFNLTFNLPDIKSRYYELNCAYVGFVAKDTIIKNKGQFVSIHLTKLPDHFGFHDRYEAPAQKKKPWWKFW